VGPLLAVRPDHRRGGAGACAVDGTALTPRRSVRQAAIEAAVEQDAEVTVFTELTERAELPMLRGMAALLRF
jgi:hypothetical protein